MALNAELENGDAVRSHPGTPVRRSSRFSKRLSAFENLKDPKKKSDDDMSTGLQRPVFDFQADENNPRLLLYKAKGCSTCADVSVALERARIPFAVVDLTLQPWRRRELRDISGSFSIPQVFLDGRLIGGRDDLRALTDNMQLHSLQCWYGKNAGMPSKSPLKGIEPTASAENEAWMRLSSSKVKNNFAYIPKLEELSWKAYILRKHVGLEACTVLTGDVIDFIIASKWAFSASEAQLEVRRLANVRVFSLLGQEALPIEDNVTLSKECMFEKVRGLNSMLQLSMAAFEARPTKEIATKLRLAASALFEKILIAESKGVTLEECLRHEVLWRKFLGLLTELQGVSDLESRSIRFRTVWSSASKYIFLNLTTSRRCDYNERQAFFINLYNTLHFASCVVYGNPLTSTERLKFFTSTVRVGNYWLSLDDIEHGCLRGVKFDYKDPRTQLIVPLDPRIHFTLHCGSRSCPSIFLYSSEGLAEELKWATASFVSDNVKILDDETVLISRLFSWYRDDFVASFGGTLAAKALIQWIVDNGGLEATSSLYVNLTMLLMKDSKRKTSRLKLKWAPYDWSRVSLSGPVDNLATEVEQDVSPPAHVLSAMVKSDVYYTMKRRKEKKFYNNRKVFIIQ